MERGENLSASGRADNLTSPEGIADDPGAGHPCPVNVSALNEDGTPVAYRGGNDPRRQIPNAFDDERSC
jgi:hypothetical protein